MSSPRASSSPSGDVPAGTLIAGFRVERVIGRSSRATVYEATQSSLDRRVALKVMHDADTADRVRRLAWPEHRGAVSLFAVGDSDYGPWLAMRLLSGTTLETTRTSLEPVAAALAALHATGHVHGDVTARNVLVEGDRAYLADFGLAGTDGTAGDDLAALARLEREHAPGLRRGRRAAWIGGAAALAAATAIGVALAGEEDGAAGAPPPTPAGTSPLGSTLAPGDIDSVDCNGATPDGASPSCTMSQRQLAGRAIVVPRAGTITSWAVRGARGTLSLQVLQGEDGALVETEGSRDEKVPDAGVHVASTNLAVLKGDRVALMVQPGTVVGIRRKVPNTLADRWFGPLRQPPRRPERPAGTGFDHELMLRVDISPRVRSEPVSPLRGDLAAEAIAGRRIRSHIVPAETGQKRTAVVVVLDRGVALDLFKGKRRLSRSPVIGADRGGALVALTGGPRVVRVRWRNPNGVPVERAFSVSASALR